METAIKVRDEATKKSRVVDAIKLYQQRHPGWSPSDNLLARETELPQEEIKYLIRALERDGTIGIVGKWPRTLWVVDGAKPTEEKKMPTLEAVMPEEVKEVARGKGRPKGSSGRRNRNSPKSFFTRAKEIALAIEDLRKRKRGKVHVLDIAKRVYGVNQCGYTSTILKKMIGEGWVQHGWKRRGDIKLTAVGRTVLLGQEPGAAIEEAVFGRESLTETLGDPFKHEIEEPQELAPQLREELEVIRAMPDEEIDTSDIPEQSEWASRHAVPDAALVAESAATKAVSMAAEIMASSLVEALEKVAKVDMASISEADLVLECVNRGYKISK